MKPWLLAHSPRPAHSLHSGSRSRQRKGEPRWASASESSTARTSARSIALAGAAISDLARDSTGGYSRCMIGMNRRSGRGNAAKGYIVPEMPPYFRRCVGGSAAPPRRSRQPAAPPPPGPHPHPARRHAGTRQHRRHASHLPSRWQSPPRRWTSRRTAPSHAASKCVSSSPPPPPRPRWHLRRRRTPPRTRPRPPHSRRPPRRLSQARDRRHRTRPSLAPPPSHLTSSPRASGTTAATPPRTASGSPSLCSAP